MPAIVARFNPFTTPETRRLAVLFGVVYFAQGMWSLPNQTITMIFKDTGMSAGQVATFFVISTTPWLLKPVYGLLSDFVPLFGRRRTGYFVLGSGLAALAGFGVAFGGSASYWALVTLVTAMGLGLAFTDVMTDALMVENGRPRGLTGAFQSVQWAAIYGAAVLVGVGGGYLAEHRNLTATFLVAACFPLVSLVMALRFIDEPPARADWNALREQARAVRAALASREVWLVAGFIFFWTFSPSFGPAFVFYQVDDLKFSQQFIGTLTALGSLGSVAGAAVYAPLSRLMSLRRIINLSIGLGMLGTLIYLLYRGPVSGILIDITYGFLYMLTTLAFLDLAAKACPRHVEGTFFALLMSVFNLGQQGSQWTGGHLYDYVGFRNLVLIASAMTALTWLLVPLINIDRIEASARKAA
ncbi:MAG TPA: MFS transporter [Candidatus Limnocylindria bacterium]|nr:MFS transporter [Candidatus Limnocylindria bacterium]